MIDIEGWSSRGSRLQQDLRRRLRELVTETCDECQLSARHGVESATQDRGDGFLISMSPSVSLVRLLDPFVDRLEGALRHDRRLHSAEARMRLRVAIHDGEVLYDGDDGEGAAGHDVIEACRLVDADPLRRALAEDGDADLAVAVSDRVYQSVVRDGYGRIVPAAYHLAEVQVKGYRGIAWIYVPGARPAPRDQGSAGRAAGGPPEADAEDGSTGGPANRRQSRVSGDGNSGAQFHAETITFNATGGNMIFGGRQRQVGS